MSLTDNLILLAATAGLTGVLVPVVKGILDEMRQRTQKRLARQSNVLEAQAQLLEGIAELLWRYWKLALEVAYYGRQPAEGNRKKYSAAKERYDSGQSWKIGREIHIEVSRAHRLIPSSRVYKKLDALRVIVVDDIDVRVMAISDSPGPDWDQLYKYLNGKLRRRIDDVLFEVAVDLGLSARGKRANR